MVSWKLIAVCAAAMVIGAGLSVNQSRPRSTVPVSATATGPVVEVSARPADEAESFSPQVASVQSWDSEPVEQPKKRKKRKPAKKKSAEEDLAAAIQRDIERINREKEQLSEAVKREIEGMKKGSSGDGDDGENDGQ